MSLLSALNLPIPRGLSASDTGKATMERLTQAADSWRAIHGEADRRIGALKAAIKGHYASAHPEVLKQIDAGAAKLDAVLENVDHELAHAMASAASSMDRTKLQGARDVLTRYVGYVSTEPLIAHMDDNPFGVTMGLKALLRDGLNTAAKAIAGAR